MTNLGFRPRRVGPYASDYDKLRCRLVAVGSMTLQYDRVGSRVARVVMPGNEGAVVGDELVVLFFVLHGAGPLTGGIIRRPRARRNRHTGHVPQRRGEGLLTGPTGVWACTPVLGPPPGGGVRERADLVEA